MKKIIVLFTIPNWTLAQYDQAWADIRTAGYANPQGLLHHAGGMQGNNVVVYDVWESEEAFAKFGETLGPILAKNNAPQVAPVIAPLHYEYVGTPSGTPR